jgi:hypothetical protein
MVPQEMEALRESIRKLNRQAVQMKMDLHDLSEELPLGWEKIPEIAHRTFETYRELALSRERLKSAEA